MNEIKIFENQNFGAVRTTTIDGEPWFVAVDVCKALEIQNPTQAIGRLEEDERAMLNIGRQGETNIVNEPGLYALVLGSRKPEAKAFKRWITHEVIPAIRKTGAYMTPETLEAALLNPDTIINLCQQLKAAQKQNDKLRIQNSALSVDVQVMTPKAEYFDQIVDRNLLTNFRETAKQLSVPPKKFVEFLLEHKYIYRDKKGHLLPMESKNKGLFEVKEQVNEKTKWSGVQTLITPKGRETFRLMFISAQKAG